MKTTPIRVLTVADDPLMRIRARALDARFQETRVIAPEPAERLLEDAKPKAVIVWGETDLAASVAVAAARRGLPVLHAGAGGRRYARSDGTAELNRVLADHAASVCLAFSRRDESRLIREGMGPRRVRFIGDPFRASDAVPVGPDLVLLRDASSFPEGIPRDDPGSFDPVRLASCRTCVTDLPDAARAAALAGRPVILWGEPGACPELVDSGWAVEAGRDPVRLRAALSKPPAPAHPPGELIGEGDPVMAIAEAVLEAANPARRERLWHAHHPGPEEGEAPAPEARANHSHRSYRTLLTGLKGRGYRFLAFPEAPAKPEPYVLLRHDIDMDLDRALDIARIEAEEGVASTFFVMVRTAHYNLFSKEGTETVERILALGHRLGLHADLSAYPPGASSAELNREVGMLEDWFSAGIDTVSFHRPGPEVLAGDPSLSTPRPHTYMARFFREIDYHSDSGGRWFSGSPLDSPGFREGRPMQILAHPIWWDAHPRSPYETLRVFVDRKREGLERSLARHCRAYRVGRFAEGEPS